MREEGMGRKNKTKRKRRRRRRRRRIYGRHGGCALSPWVEFISVRGGLGLEGVGPVIKDKTNYTIPTKPFLSKPACITILQVSHTHTCRPQPWRCEEGGRKRQEVEEEEDW